MQRSLRAKKRLCAATMASVWFLVSTFVLFSSVGLSAEGDSPTGESIYQAKCASCHGANGEGTRANYPHALAGDRSIGELTEYISKAMPEDNPGTCLGDEAQLVSQFIHGAFYSATAQARNKPVRIELSRLTVRQFRNAVADLGGAFRETAARDSAQGLKGMYYKTRNPHGNEVGMERIDPTVAFDFRDGSPDAAKIDPHEFSVNWEGSVFAPDTGEYEFLVRTDHSTRLWINDLRRPLVDAYVKSGSDTEYRGTIFLLGGRSYSLRLQFSKAKQGVKDEKAKERPPLLASISLEWKRPHRVLEVVPSRCLSPGRSPQVCIVKTSFPPDDRSTGWERANSISKEWDQATTEAAIEIADDVGRHIEQLSGIKKDAQDRNVRLKDFCRRFAERAFRRPLSEELRDLYVDRQFEKASDPEIAVNRVMLIVLKSPRFLFREVGGSPENKDDPYGVASRISFGMWDSSPDQTLLDAAAKGELSTREQITAQAQRMVVDPRATSKIREFMLKWLKIERVPELSKDPAEFPEFTAAIADDLRTSLELFLDEVLASDSASLQHLLLSDSVYLNGRLAKFYGVDLPIETSFQKVSFEPNDRAGVLSHPYLMSDFAYTSTSSPIHRGIFVARSVLGRTLRPPPEAVAPLPPQLEPGLTTRDRISFQTRHESCQSCHSLINPLGFTFENFDAVGRFRREEKGKPVNATGEYRTRNGYTVQFGGVRELANYLANSPETHGAFVEQLFHAMVKQPIRAYGADTKESLKRIFVDENFNIRRLLVEIITIAALTKADQIPQTASSGDR